MGLFDGIFNKDQVAALQRELEEKKFELQKISNSNDSLRSSINSLEAQVSKYLLLVEERDRLISAFDGVVAKHAEDLKELEVRREHDNLEFSARLHLLQSSVEEKERLILGLKESLRGAHLEKSSLGEKLDEALGELESQKASAAQIILTHQSRNDELEANLDGALEKYDKLQGQIEEFRNALEVRSRDLDLRESELTRTSQSLISERLEFQQKIAAFNSREKHWREYVEPRLQAYEAHQALDVRERQIEDRQAALAAEVQKRREALGAKEAAVKTEEQAQKTRQQELARIDAELERRADKLNKFQSRVEQLDKEADQLQRKKVQFEERQANARKQQSEHRAQIKADQLDISRRESELAKERAILDQRATEIEAGIKKLEREKEKNAALVRESKKVLITSNALSDEIDLLKRGLASKEKQYEKLKDKYDGLIGKLGSTGSRSGIEALLEHPKIRGWLFQEADPESLNIEHGYLAMSGQGPWDDAVFQSYVEELGYDLWLLPDQDVEHVVVGRDGWSKSDLLAQIDLRESSDLRIYSQEMFVIKLMTGLDPFDAMRGDQELIDAFANGHPALEFLRSLPLPWPDVSEGGEPPPPPPPQEELAGESPLHIMGYKVGTTSPLTVTERRRILVQCFEAKQLEFTDVADDAYKQRWGRPCSAMRLHRIAWHLKYLAETMGKDPRKLQAGEHWAQDLNWLKQNYYQKFRGKFSWPGV
jgi:hypothetical protein